MKTLSKKLPVLIITICSLIALNSCASTPKVEEIPQSAQEQTKAEDEKTDLNSITDDSQTKNEEEVSVPIEKVNEDEILSNETETELSSTDFTEPKVLDAVIEESQNDEVEQTADSTESTGETENILPEKVEEAAQNLEIAEEENSTFQNTENQDSTANEQIEITETQQQTLQEAESETTTENTENAQQNSENLSPAEVPQEEEAELSQDSIIVPSRTMTVKNNQYVDVVYPGRGWIYIGEENENAEQLFRYFGRKLGSENTTFTVRSIKSGKTLLHFYKNDVLTGNYIDDYLEIQVTEDGASANERITAPSYAEVVPKKVNTANQSENSTLSEKTEQKTAPTATEDKKEENSTQALSLAEQKNLTEQTKNSTDGKTDETKALNNIQNAVQLENNSLQTNEVKTSDNKNEKTAKKRNSSESLLEKAKESLKNKDYENALEEIQEYLDTKNTKIDEALYVQGQILEADSSVRNIKSAIDSYDSLIKHYPASKFWQDANKRKIYLNRYYINIY